MMKKLIQNLMIILIPVLFLPACLNIQPNTSQPDGNDVKVTSTTKTALAKTDIGSPLAQSNSPLLLIQTDFGTYEILDVKNNLHMLFAPPGENLQYNLKKNLSPSRSLMLFPINDQEVIVMSMGTNKVVKTFDLQRDSDIFSPELAAKEAQKAIPDLGFTIKDLEAKVTKAYHASRLNFKWYKNDRFLLGARVGDETSTSLHLYDLQSGENKLLETEGGILEDYWISPDDKRIVLKKGFLIDSLHWEDDHYYLLEMEEKSIVTIQIPDDADMPSIFWFSSEYIGIIHQVEFNGGINFSLLDITTMKSSLVTPESFAGQYNTGKNLLTLHQDQQNRTTALKIRKLTGEIVGAKEIEGICYISAIINGQDCLLSCETESFLFDLDTFSIATFNDPIQIISFAPDHSQILVINRQYQTSLCTPDLEECQRLSLDGDPLEILWLPDSSGFLYRSSNRLNHYDLESKTNNILLSSDLFSDYRNINAVWVNFDEPESTY
ncbi:MAG: hypothetical protein U9R53_00980 [Chloroflexota bacterium]|nr:hypothetical protein [Chloroflexota bacterium]